MKKESIILILLLLGLFWASIEYNFNKGIIGIGALILAIGHELYKYSITTSIIKTNQNKVFQFNNPKWIWTIPASALMGFILIYDIDNEILQIANALLFLLFTYFIARRESTEIFLIDQNGIQYLNKRKYISAEIIKEVERNTDTVMIHTTEWRNHLNFKAHNLKPPKTFKELVVRIDNLSKNTEDQII